MRFDERLLLALSSNLCIGLDSDPEKLPQTLQAKKNAQLKFNQAIVEATHDLAAAYKLNFAFYEALGEEGWRNMRETVRYIRAKSKHTLLIADAKRGDIGNTSEAYVRAIFDGLDFDCITLSPYMGGDSVDPFIKDETKGVFVLCATSNQSADDFQNLIALRDPLYLHVAHKVNSWNTLHNNCGLVVGATQPEKMQEIRRAETELPFLVPGIGFQGGDLEQTVKINHNGDTVNALINASRRVIFASGDSNFAEMARVEAQELTRQIARFKSDISKSGLDS